MADKPSVLFVCVHNAGRSQMAAGFLTHCRRARSRSAPPARNQPTRSTRPPSPLWPRSASTSPPSSPRSSPPSVKASDVVITMGCGDTCPYYPGKRYEDWVLEDPPARESTPYARSEMRSAAESRTSSRELVPTSA